MQLASLVFPQEIHRGVLATSISGKLSINNNQHKIHPLPHSATIKKHLWGQTNTQSLIQSLQEVRKLSNI